MSTSRKEKKAKAQPHSHSQRNLSEQVRFTNKVVKDGLKAVSQHHIDAFDYAISKCLPRVCKYMLPVEVSQIQN